MSPKYIIAIANQKGGEGKTTTAINLAYGLAHFHHRRTLLLDLDPQGNTSGIFVDTEHLDVSMHNVFNHEKNLIEILKETSEPDLYVAPSKINLAEVEASALNVDAPFLIRDALHDLEGFDFAVIDCPPSLSIFTINALVAATHVIIPAQAEKFSIDGMSGLQNTINSIQRRLNPDLMIAGALITQLKPKTVLTKTILPVVSQFFPVFESTVSQGVSVGESHLARNTIFQYAPDCKQAKEYEAFVEELLHGLEN